MGSNEGARAQARYASSMRPLCFTLALLAALSATADVSAQPVNAETLRTEPFEPGWAGTIDGNLSLSRGNVDAVTVGGSAQVEHQTLHDEAPMADEAPDARPPFILHRTLLRTSAQLSSKDGGNIINRGFAHARASNMWHRRVGSDVFTQLQYDQFQRLRLRTLLGVGARFVFVHERRGQLWGATGYMFEHERINVETGAPDDPRTTAHRWSSYLAARLSVLDDKLLIKNTLFYQPRLDAFADFRLLEELEVVAKVTDAFALGASLSVLHDHRPPTGVERSDLRLMTTFKISL